jgi:hypothetical protein
MKDITITVIAAIVLATLVGTMFLKISVWQECRGANSFFYCLQLISK